MDEKWNRDGHECDVAAINAVWRKMGFRIEEKIENKTALETRRQCKAIAANINPNDDAFVAYIMSHGDEGVVKDIEKEDLKLNQIVNYFSNDQCPGLRLKPKVFFIQACRGDQGLDGGVNIGKVHLPTDSGFSQKPHHTTKIPTHSDMIVCFSTSYGWESVRRSTGSDFVQTSLRLLSHKAFDMDLVSIMQETRKRVTAKGDGETWIQCPTEETTLHKKVYLNPGWRKMTADELPAAKNRSPPPFLMTCLFCWKRGVVYAAKPCGHFVHCEKCHSSCSHLKYCLFCEEEATHFVDQKQDMINKFLNLQPL